METPDYALEITFPALDDENLHAIQDRREQALAIVADISEWFVHVQDATPKLRLVRMDAIKFLRECGMSKVDIARAAGISEHRVHEITKEVKARA